MNHSWIKMVALLLLVATLVGCIETETREVDNIDRVAPSSASAGGVEFCTGDDCQPPVTIEGGSTPGTLGAGDRSSLLHVVKRGDTLSSIARQYDVTVDSIINANQIEDPNHIEVDEELVVPFAAPGPLDSPTGLANTPTPAGDRAVAPASASTPIAPTATPGDVATSAGIQSAAVQSADTTATTGTVNGDAYPTAAPAVGRIGWNQAHAHIGAWATVCGPVVDTNYNVASTGRPTFIDLGQPYPNQGRFTVMIWGRNRGNFPFNPENHYRGLTICVEGPVQEYAGVPQIEATHPSQITIQ